ncbi:MULTISPECIES: GNAT family N-acetyltransferase [unclassified Lentimicrobium]|uniref:GNAT family N-acetyltransferase n=1 Tax=unclassified Lentimicrobium TaxID=2677434 RepID=UPI0015554DAE|nr:MULTISPECIES: N-acetyltransferase [unclassified Lentimicrobium]NPD44499.1 N-acetyltransferase [Lentimicrobium sp. S6]NPD84201.1 N-acetyltransferase [Lentimicrobium sp. L6]
MQVQIKREKPKDIEEVNLLFNLAFQKEDVNALIKDFRKTNHFIPELSRVARINDQIIGIIMYAKAEIVKGRKNVPSIIMATIAVLPSYQGLGIGQELIANSFQKARDLGYVSVLVVGQEEYFPRFGFKPASEFDITTSLEVSEEEFLAIELVPDGLKNASGKLKNQELLPELVKYSI